MLFINNRRVLFAEIHFYKHLIFQSIAIKPRDTNLISNLAWQSIFMRLMVRFDQLCHHSMEKVFINDNRLMKYMIYKKHDVKNCKREIEKIFRKLRIVKIRIKLLKWFIWNESSATKSSPQTSISSKWWCLPKLTSQMNR